MKKWVLFLGLILCLGVVGGFFLWGNLPVSSENQPKDFVINQGEKLTSIAARLEKSRLIRNKYVFLFYFWSLHFNDFLFKIIFLNGLISLRTL